MAYADPEHFLHVWLGGASSAGGGPHELRHSGAFDAMYQRVNCFHSAVVVEVEVLQLRELIAGTQVDASTFLPHITIGVTREEHDPRELRTALLPLRNAKLGVCKVTELTRIRFPAAQRTLMQPWTVIELVPFLRTAKERDKCGRSDSSEPAFSRLRLPTYYRRRSSRAADTGGGRDSALTWPTGPSASSASASAVRSPTYARDVATGSRLRIASA